MSTGIIHANFNALFRSLLKFNVNHVVPVRSIRMERGAERPRRSYSGLLRG